eukprot:TRINITY_DN4560_c0_g1_i2.p1 TRINITY_DN4560_c0_g1~~TRINITY_DN4560_c0_g1_i2.p1  ORF type:complete len:292 (-),score=24.29 TRINITY_DN4560_c0_g1_i2:59-934(-)
MKSVAVMVLLVVALASFPHFVRSAASSNNTNCAGCIGSTCYDLSRLNALVGGPVSAIDPDKNTYYYQLCGAVSKATSFSCATPDNPYPAVCQQDTRFPPDYHNCGSTDKFSWSLRSGKGPDAGFVLEFVGGDDDRKVTVEFVCDSSATGGGHFSVANPSENPIRVYHLQWVTAYACPTARVRCCTYATKQDPTRLQSICLEPSAQCPGTLGSQYDLVADNTASSCDECRQTTWDSACCVYDDVATQEQLSAVCLPRQPSNRCPATRENKTEQLVTVFRVPDCDRCKVYSKV